MRVAHPFPDEDAHQPHCVAVRGGEVQFARPLFNLRGKRVLGSELGDGAVDADGEVHMTSTWEFHGIRVRGDYRGALTPSGEVRPAERRAGSRTAIDRNGELERTCSVVCARRIVRTRPGRFLEGGDT